MRDCGECIPKWNHNILLLHPKVHCWGGGRQMVRATYGRWVQGNNDFQTQGNTCIQEHSDCDHKSKTCAVSSQLKFRHGEMEVGKNFHPQMRNYWQLIAQTGLNWDVFVCLLACFCFGLFVFKWGQNLGRYEKAVRRLRVQGMMFSKTLKYV